MPRKKSSALSLPFEEIIEKNTSKNEPTSYEKSIEELEQLIEQMQSNQLPLNELLATYQRGFVLLNFCKSQLNAVENQIQILEADQLKTWDVS